MAKQVSTEGPCTAKTLLLTFRLKLNHSDKHPRSKLLLNPLHKPSASMRWGGSNTSVPLMRKFPLPVDNPERDVLVRRSGTELQDDGIIIARLLDNLIGRGFRFVDEIRVEDVELVSLHDLRGRVVRATERSKHFRTTQ